MSASTINFRTVLIRVQAHRIVLAHVTKFYWIWNWKIKNFLIILFDWFNILPWQKSILSSQYFPVVSCGQRHPPNLDSELPMHGFDKHSLINTFWLHVLPLFLYVPARVRVWIRIAFIHFSLAMSAAELSPKSSKEFLLRCTRLGDKLCE